MLQVMPQGYSDIFRVGVIGSQSMDDSLFWVNETPY